MNKIKVCFVGYQADSLFYPDCANRVGGSEVQLYQLATMLAKDNRYGVHFVISDVKQKTKKVIESVQVWPFDENPKWFRRIKGLRVFPSIVQLFSLLRTIDADIYIKRAAGFHTGLVALFCRLYKKKFVYMLASSIDCDKKGIRAYGWVPFCSYVYGVKKADMVVAQDARQQKQFKQTFGIGATLLHNSFLVPSKSRSMIKNGILWVASCQSLKQPQLFLAMAKRFPTVAFICVLTKHRGHRDLFEQIQKEAKQISNLHFVPYVPFREIDRYFQQAKVFINTSTFEGFPNTFVQAAKNKTPIVSLNVNPDNFLTRYECGFCADGDFEKLVSYTQRLLTDDKLRERMGENAWRYAKAHNDIEKNVQLFKEMIIRLI